MAKQAKRQMGAKVYSTEGVDVINIDSAGNVGHWNHNNKS